MVALTALHWVLIVAAGSITTAGVSVGIWQAVVASTAAGSNGTILLSTPTAHTTKISTSTAASSGSTTSSSVTGISTTTSTLKSSATTTTTTSTTTKVVTTSTNPTSAIEKCGQNTYMMVNNGRFATTNAAFTDFFDVPIEVTTGVQTKYSCCDLCYGNDYCYLFEYNKAGDCMQYGAFGNYNLNVAAGLLYFDSAYSSGIYIG